VIMETAIARSTYQILGFYEDNNITDEGSDICIDQFKGDPLEVWKYRDDGFIFVYCNRIKIGYWVHPDLVTING
jgi:hypothetical protein